LAIGALAEGGFGLNGLIDELRLSSIVRPIETVSAAALEPDNTTIGLWHFASDAPGKDASVLAKDAMPRVRQGFLTESGVEIAGGMPTDQLKLASIDAKNIPDSVLREWSHDFQWMGKKEHPEHRPGRPTPEKLASEVYDPAALVQASDDGPLSMVLRRTQALIDNLKNTGNSLVSGALVPDFEKLKNVCASSRPAPDSDVYKACYLAACALRRQIALENPVRCARHV
jgi:hypothetical protein